MVSVLMRTPTQLSCKNQLPRGWSLQPSCAKTWHKQQRTKWQWCWAGTFWTQSLSAGLEAEATSMGFSQHGAFGRDSRKKHCIERVLTRRRKALRATVCKMWLSLPKAKVFVNYRLHASLTFSWRWRRSSPICSSCIPHRKCSYSFQHIQASQF